MVLKEMSRREALGLGAGGLAVAGAAMVPGVARAEGAKELRRRAAEDLVPRQNIGIQLYSLRDMQAASVQNTINLLGSIGYPEVELFTMQGQSARIGLIGDLPLTAEVTLESVAALGLHVGREVWAAVKATEVHTYPR